MAHDQTRRTALKSAGAAVASVPFVSGIGSSTDEDLFPIKLFDRWPFGSSTHAETKQVDEERIGLYANGTRLETSTDPRALPAVTSNGDHVISAMDGNLTAYSRGSGWESHNRTQITNGSNDFVPGVMNSSLGFFDTVAKEVTNVRDVLVDNDYPNIEEVDTRDLDYFPFRFDPFYWNTPIIDTVAGVHDVKVVAKSEQYSQDEITDDGYTRALDVRIYRFGEKAAQFDIAGWIGTNERGHTDFCAGVIHEDEVLATECVVDVVRDINEIIKTVRATLKLAEIARIYRLSLTLLPLLLTGAVVLGSTVVPLIPPPP